MSLSSTSRVPFPSDLFYSHIIPDILSEHLHQVLVENVTSRWNPFYTLPLVSHAFNNTCRKMSIKIFGLEEGEGGDDVLYILGIARDLWAQARLPPELQSVSIHPYTYAELMSTKSLIQIYICTAIAQCLFNTDVLWVLELEYQDFRRAGSDAMDLEWSDKRRRYLMRDDVMHRVFLPLTCAMKLCDDIRPDRLAYIIAIHLADTVPRISTLPLLLKSAQDLESYVIRRHRVDLGTWIEWTSRTLGLIEGTQELLDDMQCMGQLVKSFRQSSFIPRQVIEETKILPALHDVMLSDWGPDTDFIRVRAEVLRMELSIEDSEWELDSEEIIVEE